MRSGKREKDGQRQGSKHKGSYSNIFKISYSNSSFSYSKCVAPGQKTKTAVISAVSTKHPNIQRQRLALQHFASGTAKGSQCPFQGTEVRGVRENLAPLRSKSTFRGKRWERDGYRVLPSSLPVTFIAKMAIILIPVAVFLGEQPGGSAFHVLSLSTWGS